MNGRVVVFDSGIGGLSVAREVRKALPTADMIYVADDAGFPYGDWEDAALTDHVVALVGQLIGRFDPDAVVIACNTASTLVLPPLRELHTIPFVGTVPAIKPAAERTRTGRVSVLATYGTIRRDYTRALIGSFAQRCNVRLVGSSRLAPLAEAFMRGEAVSDADIKEQIDPAFAMLDGQITDVVVLACTHYPFLLGHLRRLAPWPVEWIDPAPAIARRVVAVAGQADGIGSGAGIAMLTTGKPWAPAIIPLLRSLGLEPMIGDRG